MHVSYIAIQQVIDVIAMLQIPVVDIVLVKTFNATFIILRVPGPYKV